MAARFDSGSMESYGAVQAAGADVAVPDAALLFTGDYSRSGTDLIITGSDGAKFVVTDYFETDTPPALVSPAGGSLSGDVVTALAGPQFPGMYAQAGGGAASGAKEIGKVQTLEGSATVIRTSGVTETLNVGDPVYEGDVVQTGPASKLGIGFIDGTVFSMSNNARMVLNKLVFNADGQENSMLFSLVEGSFVFASGQIAPSGDMKIQTPVATMGIRGTAPTVDILQTTLGQVVKFSIVPSPGDGHVGVYDLLNEAGQVIGTINDTGSTWSININGTVTQVEKTQADLLNDADAINQINTVYTTYQSNSGQNPQAGPNNPPPSGGLNTNQNPDGNNNNDPQNNGAPNNGPSDDPPPPPPPPPSDPTNAPDPLPDPTGGTGINVIEGTVFNDNDGAGPDDRPALIGTDGNDFIYGRAGDDHITAFGGDDQVFGEEGNDTIVGGTGGGDDFYDGGEGTDTLVYTSTGPGEGVTIDLPGGTVTGPVTGTDTFVNIQNFVGGDGDDTLIVSEDSGWTFDGGGGIDTIRFHGGLNIDTDEGDADAANFEIVDLNATDANVLKVSPEDIVDANSEHTVRVFGGTNDTLVVGNVYEDDQGNQTIGSWQKIGTETNEENITFDIFVFRVDGGAPLATAIVQQGINIASAATAENVQDEFDSQAYNLNSGSENWATDWIETNDTGRLGDNLPLGPAHGEFTIDHDPETVAGNLQLKLTDDDLESDFPSSDTIERTVDLSGAASATLTFDYRRDIPAGEVDDNFFVRASANGTDFTEIGQIGATGNGSFVDSEYQTFTFDLTPFISDKTTIQFSVGDLVDDGDVVYVDNVNIEFQRPNTWSLEPSQLTVSETDGFATFTLTRTNADHADTVYVSTTVNQGSANESDYSFWLNEPVTFDPGETSKQIAIEITDDTKIEGDETFGLIVQQSPNHPVNQNIAFSTFTIEDNDEGTNGQSSLSSTSSLFRDYGKLALLATLAEAAYQNTFPSDSADLEGLQSITSEDIPSLPIIGVDGSTFISGVYKNQNAAALVTRSDDGLFLAFRGSDDSDDLTLHALNMQDHYALFTDLVAAIDEYVSVNENGISEVYVTGHSLGASMAQAFMAEHAGPMYEAVTFASPGYTEFDDSQDDSRVINVQIEGDTVVFLTDSGLAVTGGEFSENGDVYKFVDFDNNFDMGILTNLFNASLHNMSLHRIAVEFLHAELSGNTIPTMHALELPLQHLVANNQIDNVSIFVDISGNGKTEQWTVSLPSGEVSGSEGADIIISGGQNDTLLGLGGDDILGVVGGDGSNSWKLIDGGSGFDTLFVEGNLDLTDIDNQSVQSIEQIDMRDGDRNTLKLNLDDVLNLSEESDNLTVLLDFFTGFDTVELEDPDDTDAGSWQSDGGQTSGPEHIETFSFVSAGDVLATVSIHSETPPISEF